MNIVLLLCKLSGILYIHRLIWSLC